MDRLEESYLKAQANKAQCGQAVGQTPATSYYGDTCSDARPSMRSEAEERVRQHSGEAQKNERAAKFFRENPAFDEFIQLVRAGVIGI